jgi:hypothetical protein
MENKIYKLNKKYKKLEIILTNIDLDSHKLEVNRK